MASLKNHVQITLNELESNYSHFKLEDYIHDCEQAFDDKVMQIAVNVSADRGIQAVFISGPTASGKTTFTHKLGAALKKLNTPSCVISLDDYYFSHEFKTDDYGRPDFESIEVLDTSLMLSQIKDLCEGQTVAVPYFDFLVKTRVPEKARLLTLPPNGIILIEGLHGLSHQVSGMIPKEKWHGVFIMPYATLSDDYKLLDKRDIRIMRRITRDVLHRGASALATIDYWPMLDKSEEIYFPEYLESADIYINSIMPYEFYCIAPMAHKMIDKAIYEYENGLNLDSNFTRYYGFAQIDLALKEARRLLNATAKIPQMDPGLVPESSLLKEFIN